jgi:hypothetical protein
VRRALDILRAQGYGATLPPIDVIDADDFPDLKARIAPLAAFRRSRGDCMDPVIYVLRTFWVYQKAATGDVAATVLLAATLVHEITHGQGGDERAARIAEAKALRHFLVHRRELDGNDRVYLRRQVERIESLIHPHQPRDALMRW